MNPLGHMGPEVLEVEDLAGAVVVVAVPGVAGHREVVDQHDRVLGVGEDHGQLVVTTVVQDSCPAVSRE